eukprot:1831846-Rhodomonas_salina.1
MGQILAEGNSPFTSPLSLNPNTKSSETNPRQQIIPYRTRGAMLDTAVDIAENQQRISRSKVRHRGAYSEERREKNRETDLLNVFLLADAACA